MTAGDEAGYTRFLFQWKFWKGCLFPFLFLLALFLAVRTIDLDSYLLMLRNWIQTLGVWGGLAYVLVYVLSQLLLVPGFPLIFLGALLFGNLWGYIVITAATTSAAALAFLIARYVAGERFEKMLGNAPEFEKFKRIIGNNAWFVIPFVRLVPILPDSLNNYALGVTRIPFWKSMLLSFLTFLLLNALYVVGTNALYRALVRGELVWGLMGIAMAAALILLAAGYLVMRRIGGDGAADS